MSGELTATSDASALSAFRDVFAGEIVLPEDAGYDAARIVWNGMIDRRPAIVVRPTGTGDVMSTVRFAHEQELQVAVRSGGHSIPGFSTCDGGIVIDLSRMRGVRVDPELRRARSNGGALLAELDHETQAFGLACPIGVVAHTGVAGLTLGGGMGRLQRKFGLTIDNLVSVDVVTADGQLVHASEDENPELFWGMRGAGANFGIATSFEFALHPVGPIVTHGYVMHPVEQAADLVDFYRDFVVTTRDEVMTTFGLGARGSRGPVPFRRRRPPDRRDERAALRLARGRRARSSSAARLRHAAGGHGPAQDVPRIPAHERRGHAVGAPLLHEERVHDVGPRRSGGSVRRAGRGRARRLFVLAVGMGGRDRRYVNDVVESGEDVVRSVYGDATYERLVELKRAWDPENIFRLNQNIRP